MKAQARLVLFAGLFSAWVPAADASCPGGPQPRPCDCKCNCTMACIAPCMDSDGSTTTCGAWGTCSGQPPCPNVVAATELTPAGLAWLTTSAPFGDWTQPAAVSTPAAFCGLAAFSLSETGSARAN